MKVLVFGGIAGIIIIIGHGFLNYVSSPFTPGFGIYPTLNSTELDKAYIIKLSLERALIDGEIIDGPYPNKSNPVVLSTENIDKYWLSPIAGWKVVPLSRDQIQYEYEKKGGGLLGPRKLYVKFTRFTFRNSDDVYVEIGLIHMYKKGGVYKSEMYWGLRLYLKRTSEGWIISSSRVMVI